MLSGEKILVTGPGGQIAFGLAATLAKNNEVWGLARFSKPAERAKVEALGVKTLSVDLETPDFSETPRDFTYLVHLAMALEPNDYDRALRINAEGTGLLMSHCRSVKGALVMSTMSVYKPHPDPWRPFVETDPLGDIMTVSPTYSVSKIAEEAVARYCAREFNIPTVIARMGAAYGPRGGLPAIHMAAVAEGRPVTTRWDPCPYSLIHQDDINAQVEPLLEAATTPATIVNWCGDEGVSVQEWTAYAGELLGKPARVVVEPVPGASLGAVGDTTRRRAITGPCRVSWKEGFRRTLAGLHPDLVSAR
jgi:nucleoside-diphosphate-sugar epimerase